MKKVLSADELVRAERFRFPEHREAFIAGRSLLRMVLAGYCGCAPEELRFAYSERQKPRIDNDDSRLSRTVSFNLSHSGAALRVAVTAERPVGIDVENTSREFDLDGLIVECLTEEETRFVKRFNPERRRAAFLRYWVHKEAFLKCVGTGFSVPPKEVRVSFEECDRSVIRCAHPLAEAMLFGRDLDCEPGYVAALAAEERDAAIHSIVL
ncbi:MAG TPA: 4'-phosphopantetheinyl transferase superfamily protein [Acidobacteriaceae bacterium]|nr:4'-phosphopantetheinyl transferase superfamily protein [Acidobacteriaceae bacterium]